jgi:DNA-binding NtrC family response regulator
VITGETGSGKGVLLDEFRRLAPAGTPFLRLGAPHLCDQMHRDMLFGHEAYSFTDGRRRRVGMVQAAAGGVLPVDDGEALVGHPEVQWSMLDMTERRDVYAIGGTKAITPNLRVILLLQRPLEELVKEGAIRRDLAERLDQYRIDLLPLREHAEDIPALAVHMLKLTAQREHFPAPHLADEVMALLVRYRWPANVRELGNVVGKAMDAAVRAEASVIEPHHLPATFLRAGLGDGAAKVKAAKRGKRLDEPTVRAALETAGFNVRQASIILGCSERNVWHWIKSRNICRPN